MRIFLTGFMGCGKTYWGRRISTALSLPWTDLDDYIEEKERSSISVLFAHHGEEAFRRIEAASLREVTELGADRIISTGGGTPCFHNNMEYMNAHGITLFLDIATGILLKRLQAATAPRPLLQASTNEASVLTTIQNMLTDRLPFYTQAHYQLQTEEEITSFIQNLKTHHE